MKVKQSTYKKSPIRQIPVIVIGILCLFSNNGFAQGDLMIMPKRIVFDGSQRVQDITLANTGQDTAMYAVSFVNYVMSDNGKFVEVQEPVEGQRFATEFLRYFPRRVSLAPNEAQTIRVQAIRTGNLEEGEYRSHMYFRAVKKQEALGMQESKNADGIAINIQTVFGISIPVIIRQGKDSTEVNLSDVDVQISKEDPHLNLRINRLGNMSVYGNLLVEHISDSGEAIIVGQVKGVSVYTPNSYRHFSIGLDLSNVQDLTKGKVRVSYISDKGELLADWSS